MLYNYNLDSFVNVFFTVALDLKAFLILLVKINDQNFVLGGRGIQIEFCVFCRALRVNQIVT